MPVSIGKKYCEIVNLVLAEAVGDEAREGSVRRVFEDLS